VFSVMLFRVINNLFRSIKPKHLPKRSSLIKYGIAVIGVGVLVVCFRSLIAQALYNLVYHQPAFMSGWYIHGLIFVAGLVGMALYVYMDYRQHVIPLKREMPTIIYTPGHYAKVVLMPKIRYQKNLIFKRVSLSLGGLLMSVGLMTVLALNIAYAAPGTLTVTIDQKSGTSDPNPSYTSVFTVQFSEAIDDSTFANTDITLGGTAPGQQVQSITEAGTFNKTTYEVRIQATSAGTIQPTIAQELITAQNGASGTNQASTSTDNSVTYDGTWAPNEFVTTWKTDNPGSSGSNQVIIPTATGETYNYNVDWGDGNTSTNQATNATHTYATSGIYTIKITGVFPRIYFWAFNDKQKILTVEQWGTNQWSSMKYAFYSANNLNILAGDSPYMANVADMESMFDNASTFNSNINHWDVSHVTSMGRVFNNTSFNQPLNSWDVGNVTRMELMFNGDTSFNQPLNSWDVGNVTDMSLMFAHTSFNQPLNSWDLTNASVIVGMFQNNTSFNQPLNSWDTSNVVDMGSVFYGATSFNQSLDSWNVSGVTNMYNMFAGGAGLSTVNYDSTLNAWAGLSLKTGIIFHAGTSKYCTSETQRQSIITNFSWTINDGGKQCPPLTTVTSSATAVTQDSATLNGVASPQATGSRGFQYGTSISYGQTIEDTDPMNYGYRTMWGSSGSGDGQFDGVQDTAIDSSGNVYTVEHTNQRVQKFDSNGNFISKWGTPGTGDGQFSLPVSIAIDSNNNVYVLDATQKKNTKI
jgi:surface protein